VGVGVGVSVGVGVGVSVGGLFTIMLAVTIAESALPSLAL
jgi:esterase/lipase